ncbi:hypothetical protein HPP92_000588 [Vanilla planifolia]|uniref:Pentatricopeptide repeat-containing protein n=1 Tax=Vanilla planifolia TaxID=51239 RepID=A0A835S1N8_VANPL|nr:hypothetical protein HPP92_000588 [Vanilla planifolia]
MLDPKLVSWTRTISSCIQSGHTELALLDVLRMYRSGMKPNEYGISLALKATRLAGESTMGKLLHGQAIKSGLDSNPFCSTSILNMYCKCCHFNDGLRLFDETAVKCEAFWNSLIDGYSRSWDANEPLWLFHKMLLSCTPPNCFTYTILLKSGSVNLDIGMLRFFHCRVIKINFEKNNFVGGALVDSYAKCGELADACRLFWGMGDRDHAIWCALLTGLHQNGESEYAFDVYLKFVSEGYKLDPFIFATMFHLCSDWGASKLGLQLHTSLLKSGYAIDSVIGSALIGMYASFGLTHDAYRSFLGTVEKNAVIYCMMILCFACDSDFFSAVNMMHEMKMLGMVLDRHTLVCMLRIFTCLDMLEEARMVHCCIIKTMDERDVIMGNNLIEMYSSFGSVDEAFKAFMMIEVHNEFSWTSLMCGYVESNRYTEAFELYQLMRTSDTVKPNKYTLVAALQASSGLSDMIHGKQIHCFAIKMGFCFHEFVEAALIGMYGKHGCLDEAYLIFLNMPEKDLVSMCNIISSHVEHGHGEKAIKIFLQSKGELSDMDESVCSSCLSACSSLAKIDMGRCLHGSCIKTGFESTLRIGGAIIDMYCKCGSIKDAIHFFGNMKERDVISYTAMICGYSQHGFGSNALQLFKEMEECGVKPDEVTFVGILSACSHLGLVKEGWKYFESITHYGLEKTMNHYACMVDILGRAGLVDKAENLINTASFSFKSPLWRTLLGACIKHGNVKYGDRVAKKLIRFESNNPSNYVMLSNLYASDALWDQSLLVKKKMKEEFILKIPGFSWIA